MPEQDNKNKSKEQLLLECSKLRSENTYLEKKMKELEDLNRNLEAKINNAVEKSREQEQVIMQQAKLAAMGQMVTAIAHQWRQPLTCIAFIIQNIKSAYELGKLDENYMNEAAKEAIAQTQTMSKTIDELQDFLKPAKEKKTFNVITAISETLSILHSQLENNSIKVHFNPKKRKPLNITVVGFPNEFKQVLINIINNGIYAIKRKIEKGLLKKGQGEITVDVGVGEEEEKKKDKIIITIGNNGLPIPETAMNRIFEPFYTTREGEKGKGVGLYMAKVIIEGNMGGEIYASNIKNRAAFIIRFNRDREHLHENP